MSGSMGRNLIWLAAYGLLMLAVTAVMFQARAKLVPQLSSPDAQAEWDQWRERAVQPGPVQRKPVKSPEPNLLVLLRDHFASFLGFVLFFLSLIFFVTMIFLRGALATPSHNERDKAPDPRENE